jgi:Mn-dependent DtxR family transcriptional regulator
VTVSRQKVLECLAAATDANARETTTVKALAAELDVEEGTLEGCLDRLAACELARTRHDGHVRITITGEELLELDTEEVIIVELPDENQP